MSFKLHITLSNDIDVLQVVMHRTMLDLFAQLFVNLSHIQWNL